MVDIGSEYDVTSVDQAEETTDCSYDFKSGIYYNSEIVDTGL